MYRYTQIAVRLLLIRYFLLQSTQMIPEIERGLSMFYTPVPDTFPIGRFITGL